MLLPMWHLVATHCLHIPTGPHLLHYQGLYLTTMVQFVAAHHFHIPTSPHL